MTDTGLFDAFLSTPEATAAFGAAALVQHMLDFEAALAHAQAAEGVIPAAAAARIGAACRAETIDLAALAAAGSVAGTLAIPLVKQLVARVAAADARAEDPAGGQVSAQAGRQASAQAGGQVSARAGAPAEPRAAGWVHWGSTSQDVIDTAMVLATCRVLAPIDADLGRLIRALLRLANTHADAPVLARTLLQPAQVISVGFKLVAWVAPLLRCRERLRRAARAACLLQFGGAVGTRSVLGDRGPAVAARMATALNLGLAPGAWHTQRDEWVRLGCELGVLCGALGKVAKDVSLLAQAESGAMAEPGGDGRGGSSAMPHKRNPVASMTALAASMRAPHRVAALLAAMPQEHERGLGNWQAELAEWPGLVMSAHGAVAALAGAAEGLTVDTARMRRNIAALHGLVFAEGASMRVARHIGKPRAHALLERLSRQVVAEQRPLAEVLEAAVAADPELRDCVPRAELHAVFDAEAAARHSSAAAFAQWAALREQAAALDADPPFPTPDRPPT